MDPNNLIAGPNLAKRTSPSDGEQSLEFDPQESEEQGIIAILEKLQRSCDQAFGDILELQTDIFKPYRSSFPEAQSLLSMVADRIELIKYDFWE